MLVAENDQLTQMSSEFQGCPSILQCLRPSVTEFVRLSVHGDSTAENGIWTSMSIVPEVKLNYKLPSIAQAAYEAWKGEKMLIGTKQFDDFKVCLEYNLI